MAFSLNRAQLIGNLTRDPEVRVAGTQKVATFGVATSLAWTDKETGQKKEKTEFHNVVAWRKLAEICELYLRKGMKVYIEGRLQTRDWEGEDGVKRYKTEILIENMIMLGKKGEVSSAPASVGAQTPDADDDVRGASSFQPPRDQATASVARSTRDQKGIKKKFTSDESGAEVKEEEVSIDDLPF